MYKIGQWLAPTDVLVEHTIFHPANFDVDVDDDGVANKEDEGEGETEIVSGKSNQPDTEVITPPIGQPRLARHAIIPRSVKGKYSTTKLCVTGIAPPTPNPVNKQQNNKGNQPMELSSETGAIAVHKPPSNAIDIDNDNENRRPLISANHPKNKAETT
tara:strand:+ start:935 stop:1408 length:474 start_codon:yes stop_codon:yes gene_type:complete